MRRRVRALAVAAGLAAAAAPAPPALAIEVATPLVAGAELAVEVRQSGELAGRALGVQLAVDGASVERFETAGATIVLRSRSARLTAGTHEILVKSGSYRAAATVRVWPAWMPRAAGAAAAALAALAIWALRRRRALPR